MLDEVDPAITANLESRGWLFLLKVDHPPPIALIREFFLNLSCHEVLSSPLPLVADALRVSVVREPVYPYEESPPLDDIMSYITGLLSSGVLILGSHLLSLLRLPIFCLG